MLILAYMLNYRKKIVRAESFASTIRQQWLKYYVPSLNVRSKWRVPDRELRVGDLMSYVESTNVRGDYPLGCILELHYGSDSVA